MYFIYYSIIIEVIILTIFIMYYFSHNTLFVGLLFLAPETIGPMAGKSDFNPPRGTRVDVIIVIIIPLRGGAKNLKP